MSITDDFLTKQENQISDIDFWKDLVRDLRRDYKGLQVASKEIETQLEQMLDDAQEEAERLQTELNEAKEESSKLNKSNEKLLYEYK